jgi:hypothetical protein
MYTSNENMRESGGNIDAFSMQTEGITAVLSITGVGE